MDYKDTFPYYRDAGGGFWSRNLWRYDGNMMGYGLMHEDMIVEDMEYLQQMYPSYAKRYQGVIRNIIDKADYEGSFIYDQYPDKMTMQRMVNSIMQIIKNNEEAVYFYSKLSGTHQNTIHPGIQYQSFPTIRYQCNSFHIYL